MYITIDGLLKICAGFTAICVALGWLIKVVKALKKPNDDINAKLDNDNKRIKRLEDELSYITDSISILMRCDLALLGHMRTSNNTGQLKDMEKEIQDFLIER